MNVTIERAYEDLANAIVLQAIDDYVHVRNFKTPNLYREGKKNNRKEIKEFVFSEWFALLTDLDPTIVFNVMLKRRYERESRLYKG